MGVAGLVECFGRFALKGHRTPTPIAPPENLVVSGIYRHVRNPMYVVVVCAIVGAGIGSFRHQLLLGGQSGSPSSRGNLAGRVEEQKQDIVRPDKKKPR
jgi:Phospholipid methyltransferase